MENHTRLAPAEQLIHETSSLLYPYQGPTITHQKYTKR